MTTARRWTTADDRLLTRLYPNRTAAQCAQALGRSQPAVYARANLLGLAKSAAFWASDLSGRLRRWRQHPNTVATQFKPGQAPWNKGLAGSTGHHPNTAATQFKPGRAPQEARNYQPIGSLRVTSDGILERKTTDDQRLHPTSRWTPVHRLVWQAAHGPVPAGSIVVFKPGRKTAVLAEITIDRLECITRAENVQRNHWKRLHPEMRGLYQLKGAITRQVNRINREAAEHAAQQS